MEITRIELFKACQRERERKMVPFSRNNTCPRQRVDGNTLRDKKGEEATKSRKHWKIRRREERERERELGWWFLIVWKEWRARRSRCSFTECIRQMERVIGVAYAREERRPPVVFLPGIVLVARPLHLFLSLSIHFASRHSNPFKESSAAKGLCSSSVLEE